MLPTPRKFKITAGAGEGKTTLTAFDTALLDAKIGNINLIRVTSILPPEAEECPVLIIPEGALVPTAYGSITSVKSGEIISAAVGIGFSRDSFGVIMERAGIESRTEAEAAVTLMIKDAFAQRNIPLDRILLKGIEHRVINKGAVIAAVAMWY